jgi:putative hydrolase of the HAD superfamily
VAAAEVPDGFDWSAYRRALLRAAGVGPDRIEAAQQALGLELSGPARSVWTRILPGACEGLDRLAASGLPFGVVSNSDGTIEESLRRLGLELVIDSGAVGVAKPDPAIFRLALDRLGVAAADTLYVGDVPSVDVVGARNAGVRPLHLDPIGWCRDATHPHLRTLPEVTDCLV